MRTKKLLNNLFLLMLTVYLYGCSNTTKKEENTPTPSEEEVSFKVEKNTDSKASALPKKITVFGIPIYGVAKAEDAKMIHAANIMAQYLDNNEDGKVDDPTVLETLVNAKAFLFIWKSESDMNDIMSLGTAETKSSQDLGNDETHPEWHTNRGGVNLMLLLRKFCI